ncbi:uncharacterized protein LOC127751015 [Frankliniella occidentalis]|uniref:Uncharacterized protein LOC127751015 n=1 Tax=Frankliniella occidentalis TaxID=133901 RepID=A0A9C6X684_FRAOC|nr:uncharacterized protein LOC127751015 [Frankliniella occidentalis]
MEIIGMRNEITEMKAIINETLDEVENEAHTHANEKVEKLCQNNREKVNLSFTWTNSPKPFKARRTLDMNPKDVITTSNRYDILQNLESSNHTDLLQNNVKYSMNKPKCARKRKVLILADSHGRDLSTKLASKLPSNYTVVGFVKPNASLGKVAQPVNELTRDFTSHDTVVILGGANNIRKHQHESVQDIDEGMHSIKEASKRMKVIVNAIPVRYDKQYLNNVICNANDYISDKCKNTKIKFDGTSEKFNKLCYTKQGLHLNNKGKNILCERLAYLIMNEDEFSPNISEDNNKNFMEISTDF